MDGGHRFPAGVWPGPGVALPAIVPRVLEHAAAPRVVNGAASPGGLARAVPVVTAGVPAPLMLGPPAPEPVAPPVPVLWHRRLGAARPGPGAGAVAAPAPGERAPYSARGR
ncbi:DUF4345 family protein [Nocardiopsis halotolerans]|uniref:DUF4345 family protein n=1 Tax=Nocardiopsis halotolerans TaxID=124252 RepID=UPI00034B9EDC|nr:DUF4345 family protein [Nocardiopsis halotolerans]